MLKYLIALIILLTPACGNPPNTPVWPTPVFAGNDPKAKPIYGRTVFEDDDITVVEVLGIERDGLSPSHIALKNDMD